MEAEPDQTSFQPMTEKQVTYQIARVHWSQTMDLLALVRADNILELMRISYKPEKVFEIEQKEKISCITFSPDSMLLVYGCFDGSIKMLKTENAEKVLVSEKYHQSAVEHVNWVAYQRLPSEQFTPFRKDSIEQRLLLQVSPHAGCERNSIAKLKYLSDIKDEFTLLISSECRKTYLNLNGFIPILSLDYRELKLPDFEVLYSTYRGKISTLLGIQQAYDQEATYQYMTDQAQSSTMKLVLVDYDCQELSVFKQDIIVVNYLVAYIGELFTFAQSSYQALATQLKDVLRQYTNKINLLDNPNAAANPDVVVNQAEDLFKFLNTGISSPALNHFLTKELYDTKVLQKLDEALTSLFGQMQDLLLQSTQNVLERLTLLLRRLISLCSIDKYKLFGLDPQRLRQFQSEIEDLYQMGDLLLNVSTQTKFDIRNFLVWLNKITIKSQQSETETENLKSYLNKYTVDVARLREFLKDESRFRLHNLRGIISGKWEPKVYGDRYRVPFQDKQQENVSQFCLEQRKQNYDIIEYQLGLRDVDLSQQGVMQVEPRRRNVNDIVKYASELWKAISKMPSEHMNGLAARKHSTVVIGSARSGEDFEPIIRVYDKSQSMVIYYVQEIKGCHLLTRYDVSTKSKHSAKAPVDHVILDVAINDQVLVLLEQVESRKKLVVRLQSDSFENGHMKFEKERILGWEKCVINSSDKGLTSLLIDQKELKIIVS